VRALVRRADLRNLLVQSERSTSLSFWIISKSLKIKLNNFSIKISDISCIMACYKTHAHVHVGAQVFLLTENLDIDL